MSKEKLLIPELRFPEFVNEGVWLEDIVNHVAEYENGKAHEQDIVEQGKYVVVNSKFISTDGEVRKYTNTANCLAKKNEILMVLSDVPNGRAIAKCFHVDKDDFYTVNQRICKINPTKIYGRLLYYLLNRNQFFLAFDDGVKQTNLRNEDVLNCPIILPENPIEQQKIASCLSSLDEVIAAHSQKLESLKDHKKGLMQNLFPQDGEKVPKYRFKEFENDGEWVEKKLENYIDLFSGIALKSEELSDDESGVPILRGINITEGYLRHSKDIDKYFLGNLDYLEKYLVKENDIVIGMDGSKVGKNVAMITKVDENSILIQRVARIRTNKNADIKFVYQYFISDKFRSYVDTVNTSSGIPHISAQQIKDSKVGFPPKINEQQKIASCLSSLDALITSQTEKIEQLKLHKKGLMQGLFPKIND